MIGKIDRFSSLDCLAIWYRTQCFWELPDDKRNQRMSQWLSGIDPADTLGSGLEPGKTFQELGNRFGCKCLGVKDDPNHPLYKPMCEAVALGYQGLFVDAALLMQPHH